MRPRPARLAVLVPALAAITLVATACGFSTVGQATGLDTEALSASYGPSALLTEPHRPVPESVGVAHVALRLDQALPGGAEIRYEVRRGTAQDDDGGSGRDFEPHSAALTLPAGATGATIDVTIVDDERVEADESVVVELVDARGLGIGHQRRAELIIVDDDRPALVDVTAFGAGPDDDTDDTAAIQLAVDALTTTGGVVHFPPGRYLVSSVRVGPGTTYSGYGATLVRPADLGNEVRTFTASSYSGTNDSAPLVIQGLTFDGNSSQQGDFEDYQLEQAHLIFLMAAQTSPGRLRAVVEDCTLRNGVADGISVYVNADVTVHNCHGSDLFRGAFVLTGGNSVARVTQLSTTGGGLNGVDIEVDGRGSDGSLRVEAHFSGLRLAGGFDIGVSEGSVVSAEDVVATGVPFYVFAPDSSVVLRHVDLTVGATDGRTNRIVFPHDLTIEDCTLRATGTGPLGARTSSPAVLDVWWTHPGYPAPASSKLELRRCRLAVAGGLDVDATVALRSRDMDQRRDRLVLEDVCRDEAIDEAVGVASGDRPPVELPVCSTADGDHD